MITIIVHKNRASVQSRQKPPEKKEDFIDEKGRNKTGTIFADYMYTQEHTAEKGWGPGHIVPFGDSNYFYTSPASHSANYGDGVFEGEKIYSTQDGRTLLFRPEENWKRINRGADRLLFPRIEWEQYITAIKEVVKINKKWVPDQKKLPGYTLYMRPVLQNITPYIGLHIKRDDIKRYRFYIYLAPMGKYYDDGLKLHAEDEYTRAYPGGTGDIKYIGNYAPCDLPLERAISKGYNEILWLSKDGLVEEAGAMNIFFVSEGNNRKYKIITPELSGSILPGITRDSIIRLAPYLGIEVEERQIRIADVIGGIVNGRKPLGKITEIFGAGTAAVIAEIKTIGHKGFDRSCFNNEVTVRLKKALTEIQFGKAKDFLKWTYSIL